MLCVTVAPSQPPLAKVDLLNASRRAEVVELCIDRLQPPFDIKDLLGNLGEQVVVSCRRVQDGGRWNGSEDDRLSLLRQAAAAGAACIELEPDAAKSIPRLGRTKRIIAYTSLLKPLSDVSQKIAQAANLGGDLVKFTWPTPTLDEAWPLLAAISQKHDLPVVGNGIGAAGRLYSLLSRRYGAPWIYAALERGMETHDGQPTVSELEELWSWRGIGPETEFAGVVGFGAGRQKTVRFLNAAFQMREKNLRCLPLEIGDLGKLRQMLDLLHVTKVVSSRSLGGDLFPLSQHNEDAVKAGNNADLLLRRDDGWHGYSLLWRITWHVLQRSLRRAFGKDASIERLNVLVLGAKHLAQAVLFGLKQQKLSAAVSSGLLEADEVMFCSQCGASVDHGLIGASQVASKLGVRHVPFSELGETRPDVVIAADPSLELGYGPGRLNPRWLRSPMVVADITRLTDESDLLVEARIRGCTVVRPPYLFAEELAAQYQAMSGDDLPAEIFRDALELGE